MGGPLEPGSAGGSKIVVITGCSKGLGRALAVELASRGHTIVGCARSEDKLTELRRQLGGKHLFMAVNIADDKRVQTWAADVARRVGPPDILINNAGTINKNAHLWKIPAAEFDQVIETNVKGTANVLRHFLPRMIERQQGVVINYSSGWGRSAAHEVSAYVASKWAIEGLTRSLARELPKGMSAVALNPGIINTEMLQSCFGNSAAAYPTPDSWAKLAANLILSVGPNENGMSMTV